MGDDLLIDLQHPLAVIYTSGTTGYPKGTVLTYGNFWWSAIASALQSGLQKHDKWLVPMPLFHVGGLSVLMRSVIYGTTAVIQDRFDAEQVNRTLDEQEITLLSVVPTMLARMLEERQGRAYPGRLRLVLLGGSSAPRALLEECARLGLPVAQSYGLTEACSQVATLAPKDGLRKLGSSGMALFPTQVRILDGENGPDANEIGEIAVRGPTVSSGYLNRPEDNAARFRNGWFLTGDIGYLDEEGYLFVIDRRNDLIVSGGENVYPAEVEAVLLRQVGILEAGVVGTEHSLWGQVPVAVIRLSEGTSISDAELEEHCRHYLAGYKVPKEFLRIDSPLPRNASGKLLRRDLRVRVSELWNK
ncbi:MAG: o-succinylbenzoate--CoA ligase [Alicyclobacillus sp. RIFOXYA1_FULL_53_8]|nr:MAG: o-succinylbenzoate--CoA ligase [Alicyclobacillus sp. RIFOXYA1_FULL_53_8]